MNKKQIIPFLTIVALMIAVPIITVLLLRSNFEFRIFALEDDTPTNVVLSDISDTSFRVSWITERPTIGGLKLDDGTILTETDRTSYHFIDITDLKASTENPFFLLSGTKEFGRNPEKLSQGKEGGYKFTVTTASKQPKAEPLLIYGQVFSPDGVSFQQGGVITLQVRLGSNKSQLLSTIINETGGYQFDLGGLLSEDLERDFVTSELVDAIFTIYISHEQEGVEKRFTQNFSFVRQVPNIYLGDVNIDVIPAIEGD